MIHESKNTQSVEIVDCNETFSSIYEKPYIPAEIIDSIKEADILIIPFEGFREKEDYLFPEETDKVFHYLTKEAKKKTLKIDICISDDEFSELELHAEVICIATFIVTTVAFPILINMISSYLYDKLQSYNKKKKDEINTKVNIIVEQKGKSKLVKYEGTIENFDIAMKSIDEHILNR